MKLGRIQEQLHILCEANLSNSLEIDPSNNGTGCLQLKWHTFRWRLWDYFFPYDHVIGTNIETQEETIDVTLVSSLEKCLVHTCVKDMIEQEIPKEISLVCSEVMYNQDNFTEAL